MPFDGIELPPATDALFALQRRLSRGWCQGAAWRSRWFGLRREFCLVGAVLWDSPPQYSAPIINLLKIAIIDLGYGNYPTLMRFNDHHSKAEVLSVVDRAIAISRGEV